MNVFRCLAIGTLLFVLIGCGGSSKPQDLIVGKWKGSEAKGGKEMTAIVEFNKDGSLKMSMGPISMDGKYKFIDDNHFEMSLSVLGQTKSQKVKIESITKDKMVTTDEDGKTDWTRVP